MNNNQQNEQAPVQTNEQTTQTTNSKPKRKPLFQEGTFLYKITYEFTDKVKAGKISFVKIFWIGLILKLAIGYILTEIGSRTLAQIDTVYIIFWMKYMWHARKAVYHPFWFYLGFCTPLLLTAWSVYLAIAPYIN
jgi:hypothetical protein